MKTCAVVDCIASQVNVSSRMCESHYRRMLKYGDPLGKATRKTPEDRFWAKVEKSEGCWNWTGALSWNGYGMFRGDRNICIRAHRYSYTLAFGDIGEGLQVDHKCFNKKCVNPAHLREVTIKQNAENRPGAQPTSTTGVQGVHWVRKQQTYRAGVRHNGKMHWVGQYSDLAEAEAAVIAKRLELFTHNDIDRIPA